MAIVNGYVTLDEFKAYAVIDDEDIDGDDDGVLEDLIESASRFIDAMTGRTFYAVTDTKYFSVPSGRELRLNDDLLTITTLTNGDEVVVDSDEYNLLPKNEFPAYAIKLKGSSTIRWAPDSNADVEFVISVLGTWGWAATAPNDIKEACLEIVKNYYNKREGQGTDGAAKVTAAGVVITPQGTPSSAKQIMNRYKRRT